MAIRNAISIVLREQEPLLRFRPPQGSSPDDAEDIREPLDERTAGVLTDRIRHAKEQVCLLLLEAHERRAPAALGYRSWGDYVRMELGLSRRRSYELLDQARVVRTAQDAA